MNEAEHRYASLSARGIPMLVWQILLGLVIMGAWQALATAGVLDRFFFSRPSDIIARVAQWLATGSIWSHLAVTLEEALLSFVIGVGAGVVFGFLLARISFLADLLNPYIRVLNSL